MAQVMMPERRRSNFDEILQTVMVGVSIADKVYGIKASQAASEASIANKQKAEVEQKRADEDRQNALEGVISTKDAADLAKSMQVQFDKPFEDGGDKGLPVRVRTPAGIQPAWFRTPPKATEEKKKEAVKTIVIDTVDEHGNPVKMVVEDKPGQVFKAAPKEKPKSPSFEKMELERRESAENAARAYKNLESKLNNYTKLRDEASFTGPVAGRIGAVAGWTGISTGDASKLEVNLLGDLTDYIKQTSGSAASDSEVNRLKSIMPGISDSKDLFNTKMERIRETARVIAQEKIDAFKSFRKATGGEEPDISLTPPDMVRMVNPKTGERVKVPRGMIGEAAKDGFMEVKGG